MLERLYRERYEDFVRVARSITRDDAAARDAVQEAFARAIRSRRFVSWRVGSGRMGVGDRAERCPIDADRPAARIVEEERLAELA